MIHEALFVTSTRYIETSFTSGTGKHRNRKEQTSQIVYITQQLSQPNSLLPSQSTIPTTKQPNKPDLKPKPKQSPKHQTTMSDYKPTGSSTSLSSPSLPLTHPLTPSLQSTTVSARTANPTVALAPASSPTAKSTPLRPASQVARLAVPQPMMIPAHLPPVEAVERDSLPVARSTLLRRAGRVESLPEQLWEV